MIEQNNTVYPTHSCFDDAMEFIDYVAIEFKEDDVSMVTLVHGLILGDDGNQYSHAWVEDSTTNVAIFAGFLKGERIYFYTPKDQFYAGYKVQETTRYTIPEALENNIRTIHFGPWEPKYLALCGNGQHSVIGGGEMKLGILGKLPGRKEKKQ